MSLYKSFKSFRAQRKTFIPLLGIFAAYLISRVAFLLRLPAFIDEATHILWAKEMLNGNLTAGAYDGRWATIQIFAVTSLLPFDPLYLTRLVIVGAGFFTLTAIILSANELFSIGEALVAGLLYTLLPYALFYDRLALSDGLSLAFGAWVFYLSIRSVRSNSGYYSVFLAFALIACILTKTSGIVTIAIPLIAVIILMPRDKWKAGIRKVSPAVLAAILVGLALWIQGAGSAGFFEKTSEGFPIDLLRSVQNVASATAWYWSLLTPVVTLFALVSAIWLAIREKTREVWFLDIMLLIFLIPNVLLYAVWYPRYLLLTLIPLCILLARFLTTTYKIVAGRISHRREGLVVLGGVILVTLGMLAYTDLYIIARPDQAPLADKVRWQFIESWPSGYGVDELVDFLLDKADTSEEGIYVMRFLNWDQAHQGVNLALMTTHYSSEEGGIRFISDFDPDMLQQSGGGFTPRKPTFIILDRANPAAVAILEEIAPKIETRKIRNFKRPGNNMGLEVVEVHRILPEVFVDDQT